MKQIKITNSNLGGGGYDLLFEHLNFYTFVVKRSFIVIVYLHRLELQLEAGLLN